MPIYIPHPYEFEAERLMVDYENFPKLITLLGETYEVYQLIFEEPQIDVVRNINEVLVVKNGEWLIRDSDGRYSKENNNSFIKYYKEKC